MNALLDSFDTASSANRADAVGAVLDRLRKAPAAIAADDHDRNLQTIILSGAE